MNYTENYQLPQWVESDRVLMTDFNDMTSKIDEVLGLVPGKGNCQIYSLSYTGDGANSRSFSFPFQPQLVVIIGGDRDNVMFTRSQTAALGHRGSGHTQVNLSWGGNSVTLTSPGGYYDMCNVSGYLYMLVAFSQA